MILKRTRIFHVLLRGFKINLVIFSYVIKCMISVLTIWSIDPLCNMISVWECLLIPHATVLLIWTKESLMWQNHFFGFLILSTLGSLSKKDNTIFLSIQVGNHSSLNVWGTLCLGSCLILGKPTIWISVFVLKTWRW